MKKHHLISVLAATLLFGSVLTVAAQPGTGDGRKGDHSPHHRMYLDMNLTDQQKEKIEKLHNETQEFRTKHFKAVKTVRTKIKDELLKEKPSKKVLYSYADELGTLHKQMSKDHGDHLLKVKKVLTPKQFSTLVERQGKMHNVKGWKSDSSKCGPKSKGKCPHKGRGKCQRMKEKPCNQ